MSSQYYSSRERVCRAPMVFVLVASMLMPGCGGCGSSTVVNSDSDAAANGDHDTAAITKKAINSGKAYYEEQMQKLEQLKKESVKANRPVDDQPADLANPENLANDIDSYAAFTERFKAKTGKDWNYCLQVFRSNYEYYSKTDVSAPDGSVAEQALSAAEAKLSQFDASTQQRIEYLRSQFDIFSAQATTIEEKMRELKSRTQDAFSKVNSVVGKVESLKSQRGTPDEVNAIIQDIIQNELTGMLNAIEALAGDELRDIVVAANDARSKAADALAAIQAGIQLFEEIADDVGETVVERYKNYVKEADEFISDASALANAVAATATMSEGLAAAFAANPYLAAGVLAILVIAALLSGGGGGGGDGNDNSPGHAPGSSESSNSGDGNEEPGTQDGIKGDPQLGQQPGTGDGNSANTLQGEATGLGSLVNGNIKWYSSFNEERFIFQFHLVDNSGAEHPVQVVVQESPEATLVLQQLIEAKAGQRNVNVRSITYDKSMSNGGFPIKVRISGFAIENEATELDFVWDSAENAEKVRIAGT